MNSTDRASRHRKAHANTQHVSQLCHIFMWQHSARQLWAHYFMHNRRLAPQSVNNSCHWLWSLLGSWQCSEKHTFICAGFILFCSFHVTEILKLDSRLNLSIRNNAPPPTPDDVVMLYLPLKFTVSPLSCIVSRVKRGGLWTRCGMLHKDQRRKGLLPEDGCVGDKPCTDRKTYRKRMCHRHNRGGKSKNQLSHTTKWLMDFSSLLRLI